MLGVAEKRVSVAIVNLFDKNGKFPASTDIAEVVPMARGRIVIAMQNLEKKGFIGREGHGWDTGWMRKGLRFIAEEAAKNPMPLRKQRISSRSQQRLALTGRTLFPNRVVEYDRNPLKPGHYNAKLARRETGSKITKGRWKGAKVYSLTLEERATCPDTCVMYSACYGNNMSQAKRFASGDIIAPQIANQVGDLCRRQKAIAVRLHTLGDFDSVTYVRFWSSMLDQFDNLMVFGFTARRPEDPIGQALKEAAARHPERWKIRTSGFGETMASYVRASGRKIVNAFSCPEQSGRVPSCAECGACWGTEKNVLFEQH